MHATSAKRGVGVRTYVVLWAGSVFLSLLVLTGGWLFGRHEISRMQERMLTDAQGLDTGRLLELAILAQRREDLLWQATRDEEHRSQGEAEMQKAQEILPTLGAYATSAEERAIVEEIMARFSALRRYQTGDGTTSPEAKAALVDSLLLAVDNYQVQNKVQMSATVQAAGQLQAEMTRWLAALLVVVAVGLAAGALGMHQRVIRPTLALTRAAEEFGRGSFDVRLDPVREDEVGHLARTFNNMAEDIASREERRLRFMGSVAHDLRNPIVGIALAARLLKRREGTSDEDRKWLDMIGSNARRLDAMAKDLTDNVQVSAGDLRIRSEELDLSRLMRQLTEECATIFEDHEITFQGDEECHVLGDPDRLERVALNLISNAVKYSPKGTTVRVSVCPVRSNAVLAVADNGPGIAPEDVAVIFQPFGRGERTHDIAKGAGLGLFVVRQIVEAHGGNIEVESAPGEGTTVGVAIPLARD